MNKVKNNFWYIFTEKEGSALKGVSNQNNAVNFKNDSYKGDPPKKTVLIIQLISVKYNHIFLELVVVDDPLQGTICRPFPLYATFWPTWNIIGE